MRSRLIVFISAIFAALLAMGAPGAELATQKNSVRGVTVAVTPSNLDAGAKSWDFKVVLDTHSGDLSDDLMKTAALVDAAGKRYAPVAWDGAGPGGHHREGVLRFKPISPRPASVELQITRAGETAPRSFRWQL
jgi:hypothetical protein